MWEFFKKGLSSSASLAAVTLFLALTCLGQSRRGDVITNVPFPFVVANRALPPGKYIVTPISEATFRIYAGKNQGVIFQTHSVQGRAQDGAAKVVFHRYGDTYYLSEVWGAASTIGSQLFTSRSERETAKTANWELAALTARE